MKICYLLVLVQLYLKHDLKIGDNRMTATLTILIVVTKWSITINHGAACENKHTRSPTNIQIRKHVFQCAASKQSNESKIS